MLVAIENHHAPACGQPPTVEHAKTQYLGYFENRYGEQWLLIQQDGRVALRGGDVTWDKEYVVGGDGHVSGPILNSEEQAWLDACWQALANRRLGPRGPEAR